MNTTPEFFKSDFSRLESAGGIGLMFAATLAIVCANFPLHPYYKLLLDTPVEIRIGAIGGMAVSACCILALTFLNSRNIEAKSLYVAIGIVMWGALLKSGVHATLAGIIMAMFIPMRSSTNAGYSPLKDMEHDLHPVVAFIVLPVFAFANTGLRLTCTRRSTRCPTTRRATRKWRSASTCARRASGSGRPDRPLHGEYQVRLPHEKNRIHQGRDRADGTVRRTRSCAHPRANDPR